MADTRTIWMRLGVEISGTAEEIERIVNGDKDTLLSLINNNQFKIDGEAYIPEPIIEEYNNQHGTCHKNDEVYFTL